MTNFSDLFIPIRSYDKAPSKDVIVLTPKVNSSDASFDLGETTPEDWDIVMGFHCATTKRWYNSFTAEHIYPLYRLNVSLLKQEAVRAIITMGLLKNSRKTDHYLNKDTDPADCHAT